MLSYAVTFLEGVITFVSPCLLPMLPVYLSYFMGSGRPDARRALRGALGFVLGFTAVFVFMGALSGTLGRLLVAHRTAVNLISGAVVILLGLHFLGVLRIGLLNRSTRAGADIRGTGFFSALLLGIVFSLGWTPCVGAFLGSALLMASQQGSVLQGVLLLISYSLGLAIPFLLSAILIDRLKGTLDFLKRHMTAVERISGGFLILVGLLMMTGLMGRFLTVLS